MLIYNRFLEIYAKGTSTFSPGVILTPSQLQDERKKEVAHFRCLSDLARIAAYRHLLDFAEETFKTRTEIDLLSLFVGALCAENSPIDQKLACDWLTQLFYINTQEQKDPLALICFGKVWMYSAVGFAALLRCLVLHHVSHQHILTSHLLHDFLHYQLAFNGINTISQMYALLQEHPETELLAEQAGQIISDDRATYSYNLDGSQKITPQGITVAKKPIVTLFTPQIANLQALYALFGPAFLYEALLQWKEHQHNPTWTHFIKTLINRPEVAALEVPVLLNHIDEFPHLKPILANLLNTETLAHLAMTCHANLLCLIEYRPQLTDYIPLNELTAYLEYVEHSASSHENWVLGLVCLFDALKDSYASHARLVMEKLVAAILNDVGVLADKTLLKKLCDSPQFKNCLMKEVGSMELRLQTAIAEQTLQSFNPDKLMNIQRIWDEVQPKIHGLQEFCTLQSTCPRDIYQLYCRIAETIYQPDFLAFNFHTFASAMDISVVFTSEVLTAERLCIELIATIDDEIVRLQCASLLNAQVSSVRAWQEFEYQGQSLYVRAVAAGNLGCVQWLDGGKVSPYILNQNTRTIVSHDKLAGEAAGNDFWPLVYYFVQNHKLSKQKTNSLLDVAIKKNITAIPILATASQKPSTKQLKQSLTVAIKNHHIEGIQAMLVFSEGLKAPFLIKALKQAYNLALESGCFDMVWTLAKFKKGEEFLNEIEKIVIESAKHDHAELLIELLPLCRTKCIQDAFLTAVRQNHLKATKAFMNNETKITGALIKQAWTTAKHYKHLDITAYLAPFYQQTNPNQTFFKPTRTSPKPTPYKLQHTPTP